MFAASFSGFFLPWSGYGSCGNRGFLSMMPGEDSAPHLFQSFGTSLRGATCSRSRRKNP
jgi:hypothetical protein